MSTSSSPIRAARERRRGARFWWLRFWIGAVVVAGIAVALLFTFQLPPVVNIQRGYRGTAMVMHYDPKAIQAAIPKNQIPEPEPAIDPAGTPSSEAYQNIKVLNNLDSNEFLRLMSAITSWVEPETGCAGCHSVENMAEDSQYQKLVARRMIQMTWYINSEWKSHVGATGVTCYTCHRGQPMPAGTWYTEPSAASKGYAAASVGENHPSSVAGLSAYASDPLTPFLLNSNTIRVQSTSALPTGDRQSIEQTNWTYALMIHFAQSLGVSCNYCHNSRAFGQWSQSTPQRVTAWYGIRMVRDLNGQFLLPLHDTFPRGRLGAIGDSPKISCQTCHQGAYKPFFGASPLVGYPELAAPVVAASAPAGNSNGQ